MNAIQEIVPRQRREGEPPTQSDVDLFVFDLDGTVTEEEILPRIAREFGLSAEIEELTARTIRGDFPFEESLRARAKILGRVPVSQVQEIVASVPLNADILDFLHLNRSRSIILTGNLDFWLKKLAAKIPVPIRCSNAIVEDDRISNLIRVMDKREEALRIRASARICAIGEGHNDLGLFENASVSVAYGGVHTPAPSLFDVATHAIYDSGALCRFLSQL